ncbi:hypothetical protein GCM10010156_49350 [Planobispora rosea]|uniref:WGR domain-containing protein n=1 Tax=Planobispora rosea TaxID=35762 RepID=A0A8J3WG19_PLARO|nr:WGR domain-containing protein [Planobispora rosea]GGS84857.1 hypothetical protein GCM10010156_49350 [Planobispora rosea]GIH86446.1 hypothetical protein Pro02_48540 [Planobispora rosea]
MTTPDPLAQVPAVGWELTMINDHHNKFYRLIVCGALLVTSYGPIGRKGTTQLTELPSFTDASTRAVTITRQKERKGYQSSIAPMRFSVAADLPTPARLSTLAGRDELVDCFLSASC